MTEGAEFGCLAAGSRDSASLGTAVDPRAWFTQVACWETARWRERSLRALDEGAVRARE